MSIFRYVVNEVDDVVSTLLEQANVADEQVGQAIRGQASNLVGGAWTGPDAQAFEGEVMTRFLPEVADLIAALGGFRTNIASSIQIITQMDDDVIGKGRELFDTFSQIYRD